MKTHILTQEVIIPDIGRCARGTEIAQSDTHPTTWAWLQQQRMLRSLEDIEREADESETPEGPEQEPEGGSETPEGPGETTGEKPVKKPKK